MRLAAAPHVRRPPRRCASGARPPVAALRRRRIPQRGGHADPGPRAEHAVRAVGQIPATRPEPASRRAGSGGQDRSPRAGRRARRRDLARALFVLGRPAGPAHPDRSGVQRVRRRRPTRDGWRASPAGRRLPTPGMPGTTCAGLCSSRFSPVRLGRQVRAGAGGWKRRGGSAADAAFSREPRGRSRRRRHARRPRCGRTPAGR